MVHFSSAFYIGRLLRFYNAQKPHRALGYRTLAGVLSDDSAQSAEHLAERRWSTGNDWINIWKTAEPSLNMASTLSN